MKKTYIVPEITELVISAENILSLSVEVLEEGTGLSESWENA